MASALLPLAAASVLAGPNNGNVVGGAATIQGQGTANVIVNQSTQNAIINWQTFNIGSGETTKIYMPNSSSTQLDRVTGGQGPSQILGTLYSNGKVFLVNPDGILFGMGARINVGSLVATTNDIANKDFMAGRYNFSIPGNPNASIVNLGTITAQTGGFAALVAPGVRNTGTIIAKLGTIALASGNAFTLDMYGDNLITLGLNDSIASQVIDVATGKPLKSLVSNEGKLKANGGTVMLTAVAARKIVDSVINNSGVIEANTIGTHKGMIVLSAATGVPNQRVRVSGRLSAAGKRNGTSGGTIQITGQNIKVVGATINASGQAGGGTVLIGGDWGGGNPNTSLVSGNASAVLQPYAVPNSSTVSIDAATTIDASATETGNGGKVIVWANQATTFLGTILAKGGAQSGNGGFIETSGGTLAFNGTVNTSAPYGETGTWLLDPKDLTVNDGNVTTIETALGNNNANVVLETTRKGASGLGTITNDGSGNIIISTPILWTTDSTLTLDAYNSIVISSAISGLNGGLTLNAANNISDTAAVTVGKFTLQGGAWVQNAQDSSILPAFSANNFMITGGSFLRVAGGNGFNETPYEITDIYGLQGIGSSTTLLRNDYKLADSIDASGTANWNGGAGFLPIGGIFTPFTGSFNGNGNTISNLTISLPSSIDVGLFGNVGNHGSVENLGLVGGIIVGGTNVGALAGYNAGTISQSYASTSVNGGWEVGGLVGWNQGTVSQSYATGQVGGTGGDDVGGLVGWNFGGTVTQSYASGSVSGPLDVGGLVGDNSDGTITQSYAGGTVTGTNTFFNFGVGGLVGYMFDGSVLQSYATGNVTAPAYVGGLIGWTAGGSVSQTYATGAVAAKGNFGGLVGYDSSTKITSSYWDTGTSGVGSQNGVGNVANAPGVIGLTTTQFGNTANFVGWHFGTTPGGPSCSDEGACWVIVDSDGSLNNANGAAGATRPMLLSEWSTTITNAHQLQLMALNLSANYTLANIITLGPALSNASDVWGPNGGAGLVPIGGNGTSAFNGTFNGNGKRFQIRPLTPFRWIMSACSGRSAATVWSRISASAAAAFAVDSSWGRWRAATAAP
jgi:filamentous hemagglutinin family protein